VKCGLCRESGHNRTKCPKNTPHTHGGDLPRLPADELMRLLIPPWQAIDLLIKNTTAEAIANAMRQIGGRHRNILIALAELDLRAKELGPAPMHCIKVSAHALEEAKAQLAAAERAHARARAEVLIAIGYPQEAEAMGCRAPTSP
jgi:hypothetical protein